MNIDYQPKDSENNIDNGSVYTEQEPADWEYQESDEEIWQGVNTTLEDVPHFDGGEIIIDNSSVDSVDCRQ